MELFEILEILSKAMYPAFRTHWEKHSGVHEAMTGEQIRVLSGQEKEGPDDMLCQLIIEEVAQSYRIEGSSRNQVAEAVAALENIKMDIERCISALESTWEGRERV